MVVRLGKIALGVSQGKAQTFADDWLITAPSNISQEAGLSADI
ncbi:hypothetical protein [Bartonella sp. DGB2]